MTFTIRSGPLDRETTLWLSRIAVTLTQAELCTSLISGFETGGRITCKGGFVVRRSRVMHLLDVEHQPFGNR